MSKRVLFLCSGNYYRSRFAEELFNAVATLKTLPWRADSRGLAEAFGDLDNVGPISLYTREALRQRNIHLPEPVRAPLPALLHEFEQYDVVIALYEDEHRPMIEARYRDHQHRVRYWQVPDVPLALPGAALPMIEVEVLRLLEELAES